MCRSVTLPGGSKVIRRAGPSAASSWRGARPAPAAMARSLIRSRRVTFMDRARAPGLSPLPCPAALTRDSTPRARRQAGLQWTVNGRSMADAGHAERLAVVEGREIELQLGVLDGVRGKHVHAERGHAPLEALAHVPHLAPVRAPEGKVSGQTRRDVRQQPPAQELVGATPHRV